MTTPTSETPDIALVSPTPRVCTFAESSSLSIPRLSPPCSPSSTPFEPDLLPLSSMLFPPPPIFPYSLLTELTLPCPPSPDVSQSPPSPIPKKGDSDYIKRPENAFMLFRRSCVEVNQLKCGKNARGSRNRPRQADLSKSISQQWRALSPVERQYWENLAKEKKREHEAMYPGYVYRPQRARDRDGNVIPRRPRGTGAKARAKQALTAQPTVAQIIPPSLPNLSVVIPSSMRACGRSMSLPSTRQKLEMPNIYNSSSSRTSAPGHEMKPFSFDDSMISSIDWTGKNPLPWNINWAEPIATPELLPSVFPNQTSSLESKQAMPLELSPSLSSDSSISSLASFDFPLDDSPLLSSASSCDPFSGLDVSIDFSSSPLSSSHAWDNQANSLWGTPGSMSPLSLNIGLSEGESSTAWGVSTVPPMELGLPQTESTEPASPK